MVYNMCVVYFLFLFLHKTKLNQAMNEETHTIYYRAKRHVELYIYIYLGWGLDGNKTRRFR